MDSNQTTCAAVRHDAAPVSEQQNFLEGVRRTNLESGLRFFESLVELDKGTREITVLLNEVQSFIKQNLGIK